VQDVEIVLATDTSHCYGKWQGVVGIFEQTIVVDTDLVEMYSRGIFGQAKWAFIADEVNLVSALSKLNS
jgi:hypothetical protein